MGLLCSGRANAPGRLSGWGSGASWCCGSVCPSCWSRRCISADECSSAASFVITVKSEASNPLNFLAEICVRHCDGTALDSDHRPNCHFPHPWAPLSTKEAGGSHYGYAFI